jgi:hypothetical protein
MTLIATEQTQKNLQDGDISEERATRFFYVSSSVANVDPVAVAAASGIPAYYDEHPDNSAYLMKQKRTKSLGDEAGTYRWEVQCDYSNRIVTPLEAPILYEWDFSEASQSYFFDTADSPVVNSAGQPFDSIPERETGSITCNITVNVASDFDVSIFLSFREQINDASFVVDGVTIDTDQAKFSGASVSAQTLSDSIWFRTCKLTFKFRLSWNDVFADMGYYQYSATGTGDLVSITVGTPPQPTQKAYPLNGSGAAAATADTVPATLTFYPYLEASYADLSALF